MLIEPAAIGIGLGLACQILLFPKSTSAVVLEGNEDLIRLLKGPIDLTTSSLLKDETLEMPDLQKIKMQIIGAYKVIQPSLGFLQLDFSVSRWNADDIKSLKEPIRQATLNTLALLQFHIQRAGSQEKLDTLREFHLQSQKHLPIDASDEKKKHHEAGRRQLMESVRLVQAFQSPDHESLRSEILEAVRTPCKDILPLTADAIEVVANCIHAVNSARWFNRPTKDHMDQLLERAQTLLEKLKAERLAFAPRLTDSLIKTNASIFDENGNLKDLGDETFARVRAITVSMIFEEQIIGATWAWERLLDQLVALMKERQQTRLWLPRGLRYAVSWAFRRSIVAPVVAAQSPVEDPEVAAARSAAAQQSLRTSHGYKVKKRSGLGRAVISTYHWFINAEGMYALRLVIVTIALGIPAVIPSSAGFYYREKGLWALIMGQTTVVIYMSDFALSLVSRTTGTVIGGVAGLLAWYIGSGNGQGNPFGLAAVMAVALPMLMWGRLFFPLALLQAVMMCGATFILVVGYSFDDT